MLGQRVRDRLDPQEDVDLGVGHRQFVVHGLAQGVGHHHVRALVQRQVGEPGVGLVGLRLVLVVAGDVDEREVPVDWVGFAIPDEFVVGCGIDYAQLYRNLRYIAKVVPLE